MDYGRVRLWGSIAFVIGSALVGKLVSLYDYRAILALLSIGIASMLLGMLLRPSVMPQGESRHQESAGWPAAKRWRKAGVFWPASACFRGARGVLRLQRHLLAGRRLLCLCRGLPVVAWRGGRSDYLCAQQETVSPLRRARPAAALRRVWRGAVGHYGLDDRTAWLIVAQILHCGTFTVCHLAAMRYIAAREGGDVIRLQAVYSAVAMGGSIAVMTVFAGFLYQHLGHGVFWVMALVALPAMFIRPKVAART